jgi:hypothetical protein
VPCLSASLIGLLLLAGGDAVPGAGSPAEILAARLIEAKSLSQQARVLLEIGYMEPDADPELVSLARRRLPPYEEVLVRPLMEVFPEAPAESRYDLMRLAGEVYPSIKGVNPDYRRILRYGFECEEAAVRHEAIAQAGRYRVERMAIEVADLYFLHAEDRIPALETLGSLRSRSGLSAGLDALEADEEELRELAVRTLARIGRPAALALKERMIGSDRELARNALRALLGFAGDEDLSALHEYAERYAASDEEMGRRLTRAIAELEVGTYRPPDPEDL